MKLCGIVSEYNPFHKGHQYHIQETKRLTGCDGIVAVMSGNFVQRGEPALFKKELRARAAILGGADLVLELSPFFAVRSAEGFAEAAVKILSSIPEISYLSFGQEAEDLSLIKKAAELLGNESIEYKKALKEELDKGKSFPAARQTSLESLGKGDISKVLSSPNNILAVEYLKAAKKFGAGFESVGIKRMGAGHDCLEDDIYSSASALRKAFYEGQTDTFENGLPEEVFRLFKGEKYTDKQAFDKMILGRVITLDRSELKSISEVTEGIENRIKKAALSAENLEALSVAVKTKRYTLSKVRRMLLCAGLGIGKEDAPILPPYAKILCFNEKGQKILSRIKKTSEIPIIKNMTALKKSGEEELIKLYEREAVLDRLYSLYQRI